MHGRSPFDGVSHATGKKVRNLGTKSKQRVLASETPWPGQKALATLHCPDSQQQSMPPSLASPDSELLLHHNCPHVVEPSDTDRL